MYQVGEFIVYGGEGVCQVMDVGKLNIPGSAKDKLYYTLSPLYRDGTIYIPVDSAVFMRPILSREAAQALVRSIPDIEAKQLPSQSLRAANEQYQQLIRSHSCTDMIQLIKTAYQKQQHKHAAGAKPGQMDERYMKRAEDLLYGELAVSLGIPKEQVCDYIASEVEGNHPAN